ncbi:MAG: ABC transporter permease [Chloroflexia bacterium]
MDVTAIIRVFGSGDIRNLRRDSMLRWMPVLPFVLAVALRLVFPLVLEQLGQMLGLDLVQYFPTIASAVLLLITPILYGMIVGFLFLDQRDDGTLTALRVTPVSLNSYVAYRLSVPMLLSVVMTLVAFAIAGVATLGPLPLVISTLSAMLLAALVALALAAFAENKVQGFALQKAGSIFMLPPLFAYFLPAAWQPLFWPLPTYWPLKLYWTLEAHDSLWWAYALAGVLYSTLLVWLLLRRFHKMISK